MKVSDYNSFTEVRSTIVIIIKKKQVKKKSKGADISYILEFLNELFLHGKAYITLKGYMSVLSIFRGSFGGFSFIRTRLSQLS